MLKGRELIDQVGGWQAVETKGKFSISKLYNLIRDKGTKVTWRRVINNNRATPKSVFILWLAVQNRLATKDRLLSWKLNVTPDCVLCGKEVESHTHLFFVCEYSAEIWKGVLHTLNTNCPLSLTEAIKVGDACCKKNTSRAKLFNMCLAETVYGIWLERNCKVFNGYCKPANFLYRQIISNVACRCDANCRELLII